MTYNYKMRRAAIDNGKYRLLLEEGQIGGLARILAVISILLAIIALGVTIYAAAASGNYRSILTHQTLTPFITTGFAVIGALVASRHPRNPIGWMFVTVGILYALVALAAGLFNYSTPSSTLYNWALWLGSWLWIPAVILPMTFVLLLFPDGRLLSPGWHFVGWSAALGLALTVLAVMFHPGPILGQPANPYGIPEALPILNKLINICSLLLTIGFFGSLAAFMVRFRRSTGIVRKQMKWLVYAVGVYVLLLALSSLAWLIWPDIPWKNEINIVVADLGVLGIAIAAAIAILRHHLYDIDVIINRTLVYTALTVGVAALYGLAVGVLGVLFQAGSNLFVSLFATGLAAILVHPLRERLQRLINRLMYGERDDPYTVLAKLSRRLEGSLSPDATLPLVVETVAQALKLPYVAITMKQEGDFRIAASYGLIKEEQIQLPLIYQGETVGQLRLAARSSDESFTPSERRLLKDIASHIGVAARTVLLTQDLQRSREELVKSREEERRRLRRDLHDELGPQLASLKLNLDIAHTLVSRDPAAAETLLLDLRSRSQSAIADIRRLVSDLRPPALDEFGLIGAVQEYGRQIERKDGLIIQWDVTETLPPLPAAVEVAAYRITMEALTNIVRHSHGLKCQVSITIFDNKLQVELCDDGLGLPENLQPGVGMNSMCERAAELGGTCVIEALPQGGTRVRAHLPLN